MKGVVYHPEYGCDVNYETHDLPDDPDGQVAYTIDLMRNYADADSASPSVQAKALQVASGGGDPLDRVFDHVSRSLRFKNDDVIFGRVFGKWKPAGVGDVIEVLTRPVDTVEALRRGFSPEEDCDGFSTYASSLLLALGIPCSYATVAADSVEPWRFSHVYLVAYPQVGKYAGQRVALDCSHGKYIGWECPNRFGKFEEWPVQSSGILSFVLIGLAGYALYRALKGKGLGLPMLMAA